VVAIQLAMSIVLVIGAGLFTKSLQNGLATDLGFDSTEMGTASVDLGLQRYERPRAKVFYQQVLERLERLPGIQSATWAQVPPLSTARRSEGLTLEGANQSERITTLVNIVGADFFGTLRIPMIAGRDFSREDMARSTPVAVINESMASRIWRNENPLGRRIGLRNEWFTIIGVAADAKYQDLDEERQAVTFLPLTRFTELAGVSRTTLMARTDDSGMTALLPAMRREIAAVDSTLPITDLNPFQQKIERQLLAQRFGFALLTMLSVSAMVLAAIGIYGVVAFTVRQRFQELGIRLALGAPRQSVLRVTAAAGLVPAVMGVILGVLIALSTTRLIASFLFGVAAKDPGTFILAVCVLIVVSAIASYIPARKATRIDPAAALRWE
jgi:predicted permease